jgi:hypothetical protein
MRQQPDNSQTPKKPAFAKIFKCTRFACIGAAACGLYFAKDPIIGMVLHSEVRSIPNVILAKKQFFEFASFVADNFKDPSISRNVLKGVATMEWLGTIFTGLATFNTVRKLVMPTKNEKKVKHAKKKDKMMKKKFEEAMAEAQRENAQRQNQSEPEQAPNMPKQAENFVDASANNSQPGATQEPKANTPSKVLDNLAQLRKQREEATSVSSLKI